MGLEKFIAKKDLKHGAYYKGHCRNARVAMWDQPNNVFWYMRKKFGQTFSEEINHPEDDHGYDLFYPFEETTPSESEIIS